MWKCKYCDTYNDDADMFCSVCDKSRHYTRVLTLTKRRAEKLHLTGRIVIPEKYNVIGKGAFKSRTDVTSVVIHSSVKKISKEAFCGCVNLSDVQCMGTLSSIGSMAFANCSRLLSSRRPTATRYLAKDAFEVVGASPRTETEAFTHTSPASSATHYESSTDRSSNGAYIDDDVLEEVCKKWKKRKRRKIAIAIGAPVAFGIAALITILLVVLL